MNIPRIAGGRRPFRVCPDVITSTPTMRELCTRQAHKGCCRPRTGTPGMGAQGRLLDPTTASKLGQARAGTDYHCPQCALSSLWVRSCECVVLEISNAALQVGHGCARTWLALLGEGSQVETFTSEKRSWGDTLFSPRGASDTRHRREASPKSQRLSGRRSLAPI
jgi:hypothetical protein